MDKEQKAIFAQRLGILRNQSKMSQEELSVALNIDRGTIAKYETEKRIPSYEHLTIFAKHFNVSTDYLLGLTENATTDTDTQMVCDFTGLSDNTIHLLNLLNRVKHLNISDYQPSIIDILDSILSQIDDGYYYCLFLLRDAINTNISDDNDNDIINIIKSIDSTKINSKLICGQEYSNYLMQKCNKYLEQLTNNVLSSLRGDDKFTKIQFEVNRALELETLTQICERIITSHTIFQEALNNGKHNPKKE